MTDRDRVAQTVFWLPYTFPKKFCKHWTELGMTYVLYTDDVGLKYDCFHDAPLSKNDRVKWFE